jgi:hypothetical protein
MTWSLYGCLAVTHGGCRSAAPDNTGLLIVLVSFAGQGDASTTRFVSSPTERANFSQTERLATRPARPMMVAAVS